MSIDVSPTSAPPAPSSVAPLPPTYTVPPVSPAEPPPPPQPGRQGRGGFVLGLVLIALGIAALFGIWFPTNGAWFFLGLGAAFLCARVLTTQAGYAVPAGILLGFGGFVWFSDWSMLSPAGSGGLFFVFLGLGFVATYAIAARPASVWPLVPALVLIAFGAFIQATTFADMWWLAQWWPVALVLLGGWLLLRDRLPVESRTPVAVGGAVALLILGLMLAAAIGTAPRPSAESALPPWPMFQAPLGNPPIQDTVTVSAPADSVSSVRLANSSGRTVVRSGASDAVTVQATRHYWYTNQAPEVTLVPDGGVLTLRASDVPRTLVDYVVDVPATFGADVESASGSVALNGLGGPIRVVTASGSIDVQDLQGTTTLATASGGLRMARIAGNLSVSSVSGGVTGTDIKRAVDVHSTSGGIDLAGDFGRNAQITSVSGGITLRLAPAASAYVDASSGSGSVTANGLALSGHMSGPHSLSGTLGSGGPTLSVRTTSGSIRLVPAM